MRRLAVLLVLLAAACSGNDADSGDEAVPGTSSTTTTVPPALYDGYESEVYADPAHWLCRGDVDDDPCDVDLDATVVEADGSTRVERFTPVSDAEADCFYVYPTISRDESASSDLVPAEGEEILVVRNQAARLGSVCRVFAPVYRQTTLTMLVSRMTGGTPPPGGEDSREIAYADVVDAWKHYMANDNGGRPVVLIGHSQGAGLLNQLLRDEIDGDEDARGRILSAMLLGSTVRVPDGEIVGGDFQHLPLCRSNRDLGCVISYAAFRATSPPPDNSLFGRPREGDGVAACTNPGNLAGEGAAPLRPYFASVAQSILGGDATPVEWVEGETVDTPFVTLPGLVTAECVQEGGFSYLRITVEGDPSTPRIDDIGGDLTPEWGLHLVDVNLAMGDLVDIVRNQADAYVG